MSLCIPKAKKHELQSTDCGPLKKTQKTGFCVPYTHATCTCASREHVRVLIAREQDTPHRPWKQTGNCWEIKLRPGVVRTFQQLMCSMVLTTSSSWKIHYVTWWPCGHYAIRYQNLSTRLRTPLFLSQNLLLDQIADKQIYRTSVWWWLHRSKQDAAMQMQPARDTCWTADAFCFAVNNLYRKQDNFSPAILVRSVQKSGKEAQYIRCTSD